MISNISILAIAALYLFASGIKGEDCIPTQVMYISVTADAVLFWQINPKEQCVIDEYMVDIVGDWEDEYHFKVQNTSVDVSFLNICEEWHFVVTPISAGVVGYERRLVEYVPLPPHADLSLKNFYVIDLPTRPRQLMVGWDLMNHTYGDCTLQYRLVIEDQETGDIKDLYVSGDFNIVDNFSPCVFYEMSLRAINRAHPTIEGPRRIISHQMPPHAQLVPTLNSVQVSATTADLVFNQEPFDNNRCPVRTLFVESGNNFNISIPLENIEGERPPVEVNLKGLKPDSMYLLRVSVENSGGVSPPAQIAVQTLPLNPGRE